MVPFKFGGLRVRHDSTFEVDIVSFLNYNSKCGKSLFCLVQLFELCYCYHFNINTFISDGLRVLPRVSISLGLSETRAAV